VAGEAVDVHVPVLMPGRSPGRLASNDAAQAAGLSASPATFGRPGAGPPELARDSNAGSAVAASPQQGASGAPSQAKLVTPLRERPVSRSGGYHRPPYNPNALAIYTAIWSLVTTISGW